MKGFAKIAKPLTMLTCQQVKFDWTPTHHTALLNLKEAIVQAPILHYPDPNKKYIVYTDVSDAACRVQLSQEHDGTEFPIAFLSHTFMETQCKWSTTKQEAYGVYYTITKWNYYLQGTDITVRNDHKPLARFLNGKSANRWSLELTTYNITFEWISGTKNKAADCLSWLVELPTTTPNTVNIPSVTHTQAYLLLTLDVTWRRMLIILTPSHTQMFPPKFLLKQPQHQNPLPQTDCKHYCKCKGLTHPVSVSK